MVAPIVEGQRVMPKIKCQDCQGQGCEECEQTGEREMYVPPGFKPFHTKFGWAVRRAR